MGEAKIWYNRTARRVGGDRIQPKDEFYLFFYPDSKVVPHPKQLLSFKQGDESLGVAWARFMHLVDFRLPHHIPKEILMQHFIYGLKPESAHFMNVSSEGSVMYKIVALLEKVLNSTQYTGIYDNPPEPMEQPNEMQQLQILSDA